MVGCYIFSEQKYSVGYFASVLSMSSFIDFFFSVGSHGTVIYYRSSTPGRMMLQI